MEWHQYLELALAFVSLVFCSFTFYIYLSVKSFQTRILNLLIVFQQIGNLIMASGMLLEIWKTDYNIICIFQGVLMQSGILISVFWLAIISLYYFLRYYLKFIQIARYLMYLLVVGLILPIALSVFDVCIINYESSLWCNNWIEFNLNRFVEPALIFTTFLLQIITCAFMCVRYKSKTKSTFKLRYVYFDVLFMVLCFGTLEIFDAFEISYLDVRVAGIVGRCLLSSAGTLRFFLSDCVRHVIRDFEAKRYKKIED